MPPGDEPAPPPYGDVVVSYEPSGYSPSAPPPTSYPEKPGPSSVTAGGLRLDKAVRSGDRLHIDFEKHACCPWDSVVGLDPGCSKYVPQELAERGITQSQWEEWCEDLMKVQRKSPTIGGCMCIFCFPGLLVQAVLCATFCPTSGNHCLKGLPCCYGDWHYEIGEWQRKVNETLNPLDMHCKLKTYKPHNRAPDTLNKRQRVAGKDEHYEFGILVIALNASESHKLMQEPWDNGVNDGCTSGIGRTL